MITFPEFNQLSDNDKRECLSTLRAEHSVKDILEQWGITRPLFYKIAHDVGLPLARKGKANGKTKPKSKEKKITNAARDSYPSAELKVSTNNTLSLSLDTTGPASIVKNVLSLIAEFQDREVKIKMEVEII